ncbi:MAG TPA: Crp/Fnr family transcriptional regulator [Bacillota bacterium]|nr:Crp/Fnr family transcriptional regulator [Bacillota bacterium]HUM55523.1 Crp/Fnr family transcriptional regulator [Bacillota bacterium]
MLSYITERKTGKDSGNGQMEPKEKIEIISRSPLFEGLSKEECLTTYEDIKPQTRKYSRNEIIVGEGERMNFIGIVVSGKVRGEKFHMEGDVHLVYMYETEELFGLDTAATRTRIAPVTFLADKNSSVLTVNMDRIMGSSMQGKLVLNMVRMLADENIRKLYKIEAISRRGLRDRIMTYLNIRQKKLGRNEFRIMMTQEQFAQYLCVNRSALTWELAKMKKEGIIDFSKDSFILKE